MDCRESANWWDSNYQENQRFFFKALQENKKILQSRFLLACGGLRAQVLLPVCTHPPATYWWLCYDQNMSDQATTKAEIQR